LQALHETWSGISQVTLMQQLAQSEDVSTVIPHLKAIAEHVLDASLMRCSIVGEEGSLPQAEQKLTHLLGGLKSSSSAQSTAASDYRVPTCPSHPRL
jgi:Zn-dependent M16 (insulinase) family peptidase